MNTNPLVGRTLVKVEITEDRESLRFTLTDGAVIARTDADCCSRTWVEAIEDTAKLPAAVLSVEDVGGVDDWGDIGQLREEWIDGELVRFYGCKITTDHGCLIIDYRNESNGYYGGSLAWPGMRHDYGTSTGEPKDSDVWQEI